MDIQKKAEAEKTPAARRSRVLRYGAIAAAFVLVAGTALGVALGRGAKSADVVPMTASMYQSAEASAGFTAFSDYDALYAALEAQENRDRGLATGTTDGIVAKSEEGMMESATDTSNSANGPVETAASDPMAGATAASDTEDYSTTNTQVAGVDEADIVKTDGDYIYYIANATLYIAKAGGANTKLVSSTALVSDADKDQILLAYGAEMYLSGNRLLLLMQSYSTGLFSSTDAAYGSDESRTVAMVYDVQNRSHPVLLGSLGQSGYYVSSRMIGDIVYIVSSRYVYNIDPRYPITFCPATYTGTADAEVFAPGSISVCGTADSSMYSVVTSIDIQDGTKHLDSRALLGGSDTVYCTGDHLYVLTGVSSYETSDIAPDANGKNVQVTASTSSTKIALYTLNNGSIVETAAGTVRGTVLNQFSLDEYAGALRIVTTVNEWEERVYTDGIDTYEWDKTRFNALYTLDLTLSPLGQIENIAKDEWVESVRFDGDIGYFVTFRQTDPLFTVDLSDPASPKLLGALKIPGFSEYLHGYGDDLLLGIGYQADEESGWREGVKLSMFDTSDKSNVTEAATVTLTADYTAVGSNHKAILVDVGKNLIGFPTEDGYAVYAYTDGAFVEKAFIRTGENWGDDLRGLYIGDCFYILSSQSILVFDMTAFTELAKVKLA